MAAIFQRLSNVANPYLEQVKGAYNTACANVQRCIATNPTLSRMQTQIGKAYSDFQTNAAPHLIQARARAYAAYNTAYKYVTVEAPDPQGQYFHPTSAGEEVELTTPETRQLAVQRETLIREKTRLKNVTNVAAAGTAASSIVLGGWKLPNIVIAFFSLAIVKSSQLIKRKIDDLYDPRVIALNQQISEKLTSASRKKAE
jgi:hypothetical protein